MFAGKPVIGLAGGIGSGKSFVANLFAESGCVVISSDELVRQAYLDFRVKQTLVRWWGDLILNPRGQIDRPAVARKIFSQPAERKRLEQLVHPIVAQTRDRLMHAGAENQKVRAFVWDTPLLFETGLNAHCDAVVFVDAPREVRLDRLVKNRGWRAEELDEREISQMPLDKKRESAQYVIYNAAGTRELNRASADISGSSDVASDPQRIENVRAQVRDVLSRIIAQTTMGRQT